MLWRAPQVLITKSKIHAYFFTVIYAALLEGLGTMIGAILDHVTPPKYAAAQGAFVVGCYISEFSFFNFITFFEMHIITRDDTLTRSD